MIPIFRQGKGELSHILILIVLSKVNDLFSKIFIVHANLRDIVSL